MTIIIGAGPAGLAIAGRLSKLGKPYIILEKSDRVASAWHSHYDRLCLHTVKEHSNLPHLELPDDYPGYVPRLKMIEYWENYTRVMGIQPVFGQEVQLVKRVGDEWLVKTTDQSFTAKNVVVATGYNRTPVIPQWPGLEQFKGAFLHSKSYRNGAPFKGQNVLVVGIGNTGAELALDLYENGAQPFIAVRSPVNFILRDVGGRPAQQTAIMLGKLPNWAYDFITRQMQRLLIGDLSVYGIKTPAYAPSEGLRKYGKVPVIDIGTLALIKERKVKILPDIQQFNAHSVDFTNGETHDFDAVIACTGYRAQIEDFVENGASLLNERGYPRSLWFDEPEWKGLFFCGFSTPLSGILRNIKMDSEAIVRTMFLGK